MNWHLFNDSIKNSKGEVICFLHNSVTPNVAQFIKNTPYVFRVALDFMDVYKSGRKMTKELYSELQNVIRIEPNCLCKWEVDMEGNVVDENNRPVCFVTNKSSHDNLQIKFLPELYEAIKENMPSFETNDSKQKPLYDSIQLIINRFDSY
ncbi:MAG TPA: hypothetical protein PKA77_08735 [Chitinophagaceae bacterium]|jgi:hypothetical protein|nr:hypothetical protein [Chitinophagaceae bacterium]HMU58257.1 hypothetical protein [Chitinophagaceae bacterium]